MDATIAQLKEHRTRLRLEREVKLLERSSKLLETGYDSFYPELLDPWERFRGPDGEMWLPLYGYEDRRYGGDVYTVVDERRLSEMRSRARGLVVINPYAKGVLSNLTNYVIGPHGFDFKATGDNPELVAQVQAWLDDWFERVEFCRRQREAFRRTRRDGECFLRTFLQGDGWTTLRFVEPEQVCAPPGKEQDPEWSFGVHVDPEDMETIYGYLLRYGANDQGEEVDADDIEHLAINTDEAVKRGWSDFETIHETLELARKLLRNLGEGSAIQAAIAYIRQHESASKAQVEDFVNNLAEYSATNAATGQKRRYERIQTGEVVDIPKGMQYVGPPLATSNVGGHVEVLNALLRMAAASLNIPEFMVSSDASNANYSSTLVAESPFVKLAEQEQGVYKEHFLRIVWRAIEHASANGLLPGDVEEQIDIQCTPPTVATHNKLEQAQTFEIESRNRVRSIQGWQQAIGLDPEEEQANQEEYEQRFGPSPALELPPDELPADGGLPSVVTPEPVQADAAAPVNLLRGTVGGSNAVAQLQRSYYAGELPREAAVANAMLLFGFSRTEAGVLFPEIAPVKLTPDTEPAPDQLPDASLPLAG